MSADNLPAEQCNCELPGVSDSGLCYRCMRPRLASKGDFEADLVRLERIRNGGGLTSDCAFLLAFIDKLWAEYSRTLAEADRLRTAPECPNEWCPMCHSDTEVRVV